MPREQHTFDFGDRLSAGGLRASLGEKLRTSSINEGCQQSNYDDGIEEVNSVSGTPLPIPGQWWNNDWNEEVNCASGTPPFHSGYQVEGNSFSGTLPVPHVQLRPNQDITTDFDDLVPMSIVIPKAKPSMETSSHPLGGETVLSTELH